MSRILKRLFDWRGIVGMYFIVWAIRVAQGSYDLNRWTVASLLLSIIGIQFIRAETEHRIHQDEG